MKLYTYPKSRSFRVVWLLEEMGMHYETVKVDIFDPDSCIKTLHPRGQVPFLVDGDVSVAETLAICLYIVEKQAPTSLYPVDAVQRAAVHSCLSYTLTDLESPVWNLLKQQVFVPQDKRNPGLIAYSQQEANKAVGQVTLPDSCEWIAGPHFTLADIFMTHTLLWAKACGIAIRPDMADYLDRAMSRPAYLRAQDRNNQ